jgi:hypothetical protein
MSEHMDLMPFCERERGTLEDFPAERYRAGFRQADGTAAVEIALPAETVERAVMIGARFALWLSLDGHLVLDGEGLSDEMLETASAAGKLHQQTLASLVTASLDPGYLAAEDDPVGDLTSLRAQLEAALSQVESALERLKQPQGG